MKGKTKILTLALFAATAGAVVFYPAHQSIGAVTTPVAQPEQPAIPAIQRPKIDVVFALDTTGSMGGLIEAAKEKIWSIATTMASAQNAPEIRMGLVAYRDRGDAYVTQVTDLSSDLDSVYATLMDFRADGGGDDPESVNQALYDAVHDISWNQDQDTYKVVFLVGDAPPHMDYQGEVRYPQTLSVAQSRGIVINTIQAGSMAHTTPSWQHIAALGEGQYFQVEQSGNAVAIATPFDETMAELSAKLDETRLYYGSKDEKLERQAKVDATDKLHSGASVASRARRAAFNASESGAANLIGEGDLVDDVAGGRVDLTTLDKDRLPATMQAMAPEQQKALVETTSKRRSELKRQIQHLADRRADYLKKEVEALGTAEESLDHKIYGAIRDQAGEKGLVYDAEAPQY